MRTSITAYALAAALGMLAAAPATAAAELQPVVTERTADVTMRLLVEGGKLLVGRNEGSTAVSTDGGRSFRPGPNFRNGLPPAQDSAQWFWVQGVAFANPRRGWLSVKGVGTYVTSDGGAHWDLEHSQDETFGLDVGDATAADVEHALIAGPTTVSTRPASRTSPAWMSTSSSRPASQPRSP